MELLKKKNKRGITLIALVITIIILMILAGVTIATLTGNNGIFIQTKNAKEQTEIASEKEIINLAVIATMEKEKHRELKQQTLQEQMDKLAGEGKTEVFDAIGNFEIYFKESKRYYQIDNEGNIGGYEIAEEIYNAGDITKGGTLDGSDKKPYEISCIEDLVALSYSVNGIQVVDGNLEITTSYKTFLDEYLLLTRNLNFASNFSYENSERTDYGDINSNGIVETLIKELTTGKGWIIIGGYPNTKNAFGFYGNFNGNEKVIKNMYIYNEEETSYAGLFGITNRTSIKDLGVTGNIYCNSSAAGGIIATVKNQELNITNCYFKGKVENINTAGRTGGVIGQIHVGTTNVIKCYCEGEVIGNNTEGGTTSTGGIVGYGTSANVKIENSYNEANVTGIGSVGGIMGRGATGIYNCYNTGMINGTNSVGGIVGYHANIIERCYNKGKITAIEYGAGGIAGQIYAGSNEKIYQCYNEGKISGISEIGGILGRIYSAKSLTIEQCYNIGEITGTTYTAGIVGSISGGNAKILNCYNRGNINGTNIAGVAGGNGNISTAKVVSCYNRGKLNSSLVSGILSKRGTDSVTYNSYYLESCGATDTVAISTTETDLKAMSEILDKTFKIDDDANTVTINEEEKQNVWVEDENNKNDGYPILQWQMEE